MGRSTYRTIDDIDLFVGGSLEQVGTAANTITSIITIIIYITTITIITIITIIISITTDISLE